MSDVVTLFDRLVAPIRRKLVMMVARGVAELVDDSTRAQSIQVSMRADTLADGAERFQQFGFTSHPLPGAEVLVVHVGGEPSHPVVIAVEDRRYRPTTLAEGESAMYTAQNGVRVLNKADGTVELGTNPTEPVALDGPLRTWFQGFLAVLNTPVNEPGNGSPSAFEAAIAVWLAANPYPTTVAATEVKAK